MLEVCVDSLESALNAIHGEVDEIEVCSSLAEGGLTPSPGLVKEILRARPKINVMIRCRMGSDFCYSSFEMDTMLSDLMFFKEIGADRFVFGCLTNTQDIDKENCRKIIEAAKPFPVTFHRAFDICNDPLKAVEEIIDLGFDRILTSGQQPCAGDIKAISLITQLIVMFGDVIQIMPGAGVNSKNVTSLIAVGCKIFHSSCKRSRQLKRIKNDLNMGTVDSEFIIVSDENIVKELKEVICKNLVNLG
ncbi:Copper homeostasis protein cutC homolog [Eumeta japonica]|uniref:Copper homeostasis protein cutC homolog n=1 Tax=Eumeta variegata TaxID=151549 RepID=A0A4C1XCM2_EUMVA|nr:Copper homeostasis protein cutC homolog [Eumeta japonica]